MKRAALLAVLAVSLQPATLRAMDRLAALSMLETGDNDRMVGRVGEVSRFQIRPELWRKYGHGDPRNPGNARPVVKRLMAERLAKFQARFHRTATNFDFYVLWNAPAQAGHPSAVVQERAERFANLCSRA